MSAAVIKDSFITESALKFSHKLNSKKVLDLSIEQCYMAITPCLVVGDEKPLDVESNGFFFYPITSENERFRMS